MPIYEYACRDCGHELEQLQRLSDDVLIDCPACGQARLKRKISAAGFRLSGSGWYETDFKSDSRRNIAGSEGHSDGSESSNTEKSSGNGTSGEGDKSESSGDKAAKTSKTGDDSAKKSAARKNSQSSNA